MLEGTPGRLQALGTYSRPARIAEDDNRKIHGIAHGAAVVVAIALCAYGRLQCETSCISSCSRDSRIGKPRLRSARFAGPATIVCARWASIAGPCVPWA